jgi:ubiquinone/menaquinone biosynthesis C-methylase UbiE
LPVNTNAWNRRRYTFWAPLYDTVGRLFDGRREASIRLLDPRPGETVVIVGAGTGPDLRFIPNGCRVAATDLTAAMLVRARPRAGEGVHLAVMDGHSLALGSACADAAVLHLIVAVIPDPVRCLQEVARVLRPGGRVAVFDKFVRGRAPLSLRAVNVLTNTLMTDVTRSFEDILERAGVPLVVEQDRPAMLRGLFRHILLRKRADR